MKVVEEAMFLSSSTLLLIVLGKQESCGCDLPNFDLKIIPCCPITLMPLLEQFLELKPEECFIFELLSVFS